MRREIRPLVKTLLERQGLISIGFLVLAILYTFYFAKALLMPVFLAILFALVLRPCVRFFLRFYIPEILSSAVILLALLLLGGWLVLTLSEPASEWIDRGPLLKAQLEYKLEALLTPLEKVKEVTQNIQDAAEMGDKTENTVVVEGPSLLQRIMIEAQSTLINIVVVLVLMFFLLSRSGWTYRRVVATIKDEDRREVWNQSLNRIQKDLAHYLATIAGINIMLGLVTAGVMLLLEMPNPMLWGVLACVMNFIPYAGALVTLTVIGLVSILTFSDVVSIILPPAAFLLITLIEGQIISPFVVSRRLTLDPIAVFFSVLFWGWLWGFPGMLLAVPILALFKITISTIDSLAPLSAAIDSDSDQAPEKALE